MWAPAISIAAFKDFYLNAITKKRVERFALFALTDKAERDDNCGGIYHKSLLYLVSNAFEEKMRMPFSKDGEPILGMQKFLEKDTELKALFSDRNAVTVLCPNTSPDGSDTASNAKEHGAFDDDVATVKAALARILNMETNNQSIDFNASASSLKTLRNDLQITTRFTLT